MFYFASPRQVVCGNKRKANTHPAPHGGMERQAVPGLQAEHKQRMTKAKAQEWIEGANTEILQRRILVFIRLLN